MLPKIITMCKAIAAAVGGYISRAYPLPHNSEFDSKTWHIFYKQCFSQSILLKFHGIVDTGEILAQRFKVKTLNIPTYINIYVLVWIVIPNWNNQQQKCAFFPSSASTTTFSINFLPTCMFNKFRKWAEAVEVKELCVGRRMVVVKCTLYGNIRSLSEVRACLLPLPSPGNVIS